MQTKAKMKKLDSLNVFGFTNAHVRILICFVRRHAQTKSKRRRSRSLPGLKGTAQRDFRLPDFFNIQTSLGH